MKTMNVKAENFSTVNAVYLAELASMAYLKPQEINEKVSELGFRHEEFFQDEGTDTQVFIACNDNARIISFRGTEPGEIKDWESDMEVHLTDALGGKVHKGFYKALNSVWEKLLPSLLKDDRPLWVTGHSLGAAIAVLAVAKLYKEKNVKAQGLYTFGQPRCGDHQFSEKFDELFAQKTFRFVNHNDIVPRVPLKSMHYAHVGQSKYFNKNGKLGDELSWRHNFFSKLEDDFVTIFTGEALTDHQMKNYLENTKNIEGPS